ncbi:uncharacterized protein LOC100302487 isoform X2 [Acyrthosiphon pisum]|uniref:Uncharacterized protein n=1 Tax=Acyrthosiphon pisum TaxID=7029 RepID=A0A8R2FCX9_ACYPI|nr:uncharacterized protein LOC100302487 isoform X2 [Acyrthosiphon pisum]|eukprot:XP_008188234.1 PREDICTED: uncharacterized protein LOC100302487 isoform X4 [Acyrthosiphon pisum]
MVKYINYILSIFLVLIFIGCIYADVEECLGQMNSVNLTVLRDESNGKPTRIEKLPYVKDYIDIIHKEGKVIIRPVQFCLNVKQ